jgi:hypothetical protein
VLSKIELEFLKSPKNFDADYSRVLRHRIKAKTAHLHEQLALIDGSALSVTENCNGITEFCNGEQIQNAQIKPLLLKEGGPSRTRTGDLWLVKPTS